MNSYNPSPRKSMKVVLNRNFRFGFQRPHASAACWSVTSPRYHPAESVAAKGCPGYRRPPSRQTSDPLHTPLVYFYPAPVVWLCSALDKQTQFSLLQGCVLEQSFPTAPTRSEEHTSELQSL